MMEQTPIGRVNEIHTMELVDISRSTKPKYEMTPAQKLAYLARVSNPANQGNHATGWKLLETLIKRAEWSPFDLQSVTMEVLTTRDVSRQMIRHRSLTFQEFSQRYADPVNTLGFTYRKARLQDHKNRQNSIITTDERIIAEWQDIQYRAVEVGEYLYDRAIQMGIAREVARALLPEGLTVTRMYVHGRVRDWMFYLRLRAQKETQYEHRLVAQSGIKELLVELPDLQEFFGTVTNDE